MLLKPAVHLLQLSFAFGSGAHWVQSRQALVSSGSDGGQHPQAAPVERSKRIAAGHGQDRDSVFRGAVLAKENEMRHIFAHDSINAFGAENSVEDRRSSSWTDTTKGQLDSDPQNPVETNQGGT